MSSCCTQEANLLSENWAMIEEILVDDQEREGKFAEWDQGTEAFKLLKKDLKKISNLV